MAKNEFDELMSIGIDIGKDTSHLVGFDQAEHPIPPPGGRSAFFRPMG